LFGANIFNIMKLSSIFKYIFRIIFLFIIIIVICMVCFLAYLFTGKTEKSENINFGITFSQMFAEQMELNWKEVYTAMLDELNVKKLRLIAYWPKIEPNEGEYAFDDLDWQINEAEKRDVQIILAIGRKLPRWPECHIPEWARELDESEQQEKLLSLLTQIVNRYKDNQTIKIWQVENEPFLMGFGECPKLDKDFLKKEISLVRELDSKKRPILITASGELSLWTQSALIGDVFGTTLYRIVWSDVLQKHVEYPIPSVFYYKRAKLVKWLTGVEKMIIVELQAEPWSHLIIHKNTLEEQFKTMDLKRFKEIIDYAKYTGFDKAYLWGVEWWYWIKENHNIDIFWQEAKKLWNN